MLRTSWRQIAALALVFCLTLIVDSLAQSHRPSPRSGEPIQQEQTHPSGSQKSPATNQQNANQPPIIVNVLPPQKSEEEATEERQERDGKAALDRRAVDLTAELARFTAGLFYATVILAIATVLLFIVTAGLLIFAFFQSRDMKASIAVAAKSAEATISAAAAARGVLESDRAWITWNQLGIAVLTNTTFNGKEIKNGVGFYSNWKNTGRSPAQNVSCVNIARLVEPGARVPIVNVGVDDSFTTESSRGVGQEISGSLIPFNDSDSADFKSRKKNLLFYSRVEYFDIFNKDSTVRISEACLKLSFAGGTIIRGKEKDTE